jgi:hypothetical protein
MAVNETDQNPCPHRTDICNSGELKQVKMIYNPIKSIFSSYINMKQEVSASPALPTSYLLQFFPKI